MNKGLPPAPSTICRPTSSGPDHSPRRLPTRRSLSSDRSGSKRITAPTSLQSGRVSSSSGRARQSRSTGCPDANSARYWTRSRNVDSAHWMSSKTTTSGLSLARPSKPFRMAQKDSWMGPAVPPRPKMAASRSTTRGSGPGARMAAILASASPAEVVSSSPIASRSTSAIGQNVMPSPYGRQRPRRTRAVSPTEVTTSCVSRDLPTPAWPMTVTRRHVEPAAASSNASRITASSLVRPTSGVSNRRGRIGAPASTTTSR